MSLRTIIALLIPLGTMNFLHTQRFILTVYSLLENNLFQYSVFLHKCKFVFFFFFPSIIGLRESLLLENHEIALLV